MIKFFKKEKKLEKESLEFNVNLYWKLAVCFMLVVVILSALFGYYFFAQINQEIVVSVSDNSVKIETVKKERIDKMLELFSLREKKSTEILNSPAPVIDPSL